MCHVKVGDPCSEQKGTPAPRALLKNSSPDTAGLCIYCVCFVFPANLRDELTRRGFVAGLSTDRSCDDCETVQTQLPSAAKQFMLLHKPGKTYLPSDP